VAVRQTRTVIVAGAGIAGLTASLALARTGFRVVLLERAPRLSEAGAGIQLSPNAGRVLAELGLEPAIAAVASEPKAIDIHLGRSGQPLATLALGERIKQKFGIPYRVVHRADLQRTLANAVRDSEIDLKLGTEMSAFGVHANGLTVLASADAGHQEIRANALVAADGVHSLVRRLMPGGSPKQPLGRVAWRAVLPLADAPTGLSSENVGLWLGRDAHLVHYPLRGGTEINVVAIVKDGWTSTSWSAPGDPNEIADRFRRWAPLPRALLDAVTRWSRWPVLSVSPRGPWAMGPVALLGDAAHAMPPFLAQGGAMAIEDAAVLAASLAARPGDPEAAMRAYARARRRRVSRVWRNSRSNGDLYHMSGIPGMIRDIGIQLLGSHGLVSSYNWIYQWRPPFLPPATPPSYEPESLRPVHADHS
jgi:salicylate hydroxylase